MRSRKLFRSKRKKTNYRKISSHSNFSVWNSKVRKQKGTQSFLSSLKRRKWLFSYIPTGAFNQTAWILSSFFSCCDLHAHTNTNHEQNWLEARLSLYLAFLLFLFCSRPFMRALMRLLSVFLYTCARHMLSREGWEKYTKTIYWLELFCSIKVKNFPFIKPAKNF